MSSSVQLQREDPHVLALVDAPVVEAPQLGALVLGVPLPELVAVGVDALLGAGLLLVAASATEGGREALLLERVEQGADLQPVAAGLPVVDDHAVLDGLLDAGDDQAQPESVDPRVAAGEDLGEVVAGVDLEHGEGDLGGVERLLGEPQHDDGVLAAGEHQHRLLELGGDLAEDVDGLRFQLVQLAHLVVGVRRGCTHAVIGPLVVTAVIMLAGPRATASIVSKCGLVRCGRSPLRPRARPRWGPRCWPAPPSRAATATRTA